MQHTRMAANRQSALGSDSSPAARLVERCLTEATAAGASDLHLEPEEKGLRLRARIDGSLCEMASPPPALVGPFLARLRLLAGADIAERRLPQEGRFRVSLGDSGIVDVRCAFLPVTRGEKITLRLLARKTTPRSLAALGLPSDCEVRVKTHLSRPDGLIVVAGPTGSGKTTTLYACMEEAQRPDRSMVSVEDPVEAELAAVAQVPVHEEIGRGFAPVLRALLRHDPDVIMIGEIRDTESAAIACRAALTGHLVLSSLHATDCAEVAPRLREMGVPNYLVHATLRLVVAQRLLRTPCTDCAIAAPPSREELRWLVRFDIQAPNSVLRSVGCPQCNGTGYLGRTPAFAVVEPSSNTGNSCLLAAALDKVVARQTTMAEALARCPVPPEPIVEMCDEPMADDGPDLATSDCG
ncbi:MAG: type II secretory ATPase GspE/PulE/Tfp pilus assembly ATPase PilB-like protein [Hyphomicrobiaceae bacterium]|jgi:type II secretory ATPase GspE/PulE/Tfp pilus assembly ATPase PilB-like protein